MLYKTSLKNIKTKVLKMPFLFKNKKHCLKKKLNSVDVREPMFVFIK